MGKFDNQLVRASSTAALSKTLKTFSRGSERSRKTRAGDGLIPLTVGLTNFGTKLSSLHN